MQKFRYLYIKKKYRWFILPLLLLVVVLAYTGKFFEFGPDNELDAMHRVEATGQLVALTDQNSLDYFIYSGEPMGYQYELLRSFASYLNVHLKIISAKDISKLQYYLDLNLGDLIAADIPYSKEGREMVRFCKEMNESRQVLVQRKSNGKKTRHIKDLKELDGDTIYVQVNPFLYPYLYKQLRKAGANAVIVSDEDHNAEGLIDRVSGGKINFTICDENLASVIQDSYSNLDVSLYVTDPVSTGWVVRHSSDTLKMKIDEWVATIQKNGKLKKLYAQYFDNRKIAGYFHRDYFSVTDEKLSPYDQQIRNYSRMIFWDWRLVASLIYEESNFRTGLVSSRNASGLMQLMPETMNLMGVDSTSSPSQQILAGVKYLKWLDSQLPEEITDKRERINFILASYNVGIGKVLEARKLAEKNGKDPNKWDDNVDYYLTNKSKRNPVKDEEEPDRSPYGMTGGFVAKIIERYQHYRNNIPE